MGLLIPFLIPLLSLIPQFLCYNFPHEGIQLTEAEVKGNPDLDFGKWNPSRPNKNITKCKAWPGDANWPNQARWDAFNSSLSGALIKGVPPASYCYAGAGFDQVKCAATRSGRGLFWVDDPVSPLQLWTTGNSCPVPSALRNYTCTNDGTPAYVVNATTVKQVQLAVNFARNNNIRVVIKNSGHDFSGRATGGGSLSIWTHYLKGFEYLPSAQIGRYRGRAARAGTGIMSYELHQYMRQYNITIPAPGATTPAPFGGYMLGGGHSIIASYYGLMSDNILSMEVVTGDGKFVHADPEENEDLFWALRGGGGSTFGVVTSVVVKAHPAMYISKSTYLFSIGPGISSSTFWAGVSAYFAELPRVMDAKGTGWNTIGAGFAWPPAPGGGNNTAVFALNGAFYLPGMTPAQAKTFTAPLTARLQKLGINITNPEPQFYATYPDQGFPLGSAPAAGAGSSRFGSRLFPRSSFTNPNSRAFKSTMAAIRSFVEDGRYNFHSVDYQSTVELAGYPGSSSAVPDFHREAIVHATGFDTASYGPDVSPAQQKANHKRLDSYIQKWRDVTPGGGAYANEADVQEPDWQEAFFGDTLERLEDIKRDVDPWGVFWSASNVGSEGWKITGEGAGGDGEYGRGMLCRVE
ncbi:FAD-binding domain-containing protein [Delitschia confertaspora ATCC 74209]|uniref:FAD-binding domain-containing protein n=1 Tax=Delitschia confertaspora ATCC 74209 TaxID=1513339 RepID=A0A9P4JHB2_9PLEO|nr:FAD-binding domain-containing protein [Delitschia confertaspora ATCC 74209]